MRRLLPLFILLAAVAVAGLLIASRSELSRRPVTLEGPLVRIVAVEPGPVQVQLRSQGTVAPKQQIDLASELSGRIVWVAPEFQTGGLVPSGTPLLKIEAINYQLAVAEAEAGLATAELELVEAQVLRKKAAIEQAQANRRAAIQKLRKARSDLEKTEIRAPFDAVIDRREVDLGQYVTVGTTLMRLMGTDFAEVRLPILPSDVRFLRYGEQPDGDWPIASLSARFGQKQVQWPARLARLESRVDSSTRVFYLVAEIESPYRETGQQFPLFAGLFVEAEFGGESIPEAVRLPRVALQDDGSVFVVAGGDVLERRMVRIARSERDSVIVIVGEGLVAGDRVVVDRLELMVEGMRVRIAPPAAG